MIASSKAAWTSREVAHDALRRSKGDVDPLRFDRRAGAKKARGIGVPVEATPPTRPVIAVLNLPVLHGHRRELAEINPLNPGQEGNLVALDAKFNFDSNALFRHPKSWPAATWTRRIRPRSSQQVRPGLHPAGRQHRLPGQRRGPAMATMDTIKLFGGEPANFLDVGGGATAEKVTEAFKIMLKNPKVKGILVNIFGGIMRATPSPKA